MPEATACPPAVVADTIMRTIALGVTITDAAVDEKQTTIFCTPVARDPRCPDCGRQGRYRDTVTRPLTDLPVAGYPLVSRVAVPRYRCDTVECGRAVFDQDLGKLACPRSSTDAWKPYAATPSDFETSPTTEFAHCSTAAHSTHSSMHSELRRATIVRNGRRPAGSPGLPGSVHLPARRPSCTPDELSRPKRLSFKWRIRHLK